MTIDIDTILPDTDLGWAGIIQWLAESTDGWFWILFLVGLMIISGTPVIYKWGIDWALLSVSLIGLLLGLPIWLAGGLVNPVFFSFIIFFVVSIIKFALFPDH